MPIEFEEAKKADAAAIAALRLSVARQLTTDFGKGTWSYAAESEGGVRADIMTSRVFVARDEGTIVASLRLSPRSPWMVPVDGFTASVRPVYLTSMAVSPKRQRCGIGRICVEEAKRIAAEWHADAIRLDAYDSPAGAGNFYAKCGFREALRAPYHGTRLIFFEFLVGVKETSLLRPLRDAIRSDS